MDILRLNGLSKRFGGLVAVDDVSLQVEEGGIVGIIGPNGAGKTTVFNLITGNYRPDEGEIILAGQNITGLLPHRIVELGVARTFQNIRLFQEMNALENVLAGCHCRLRAGILASMFHLPSQKREERLALERAIKELAFVGLETQYANYAKNLAYGSQRLLEIARALASSPRLLILDEPAGGMNDQETRNLLELIRAIRDLGISILLIEHDMNLVMKLCDRLVVLEYGAVIATGGPEEIKKNPRVIEAYLGTEDPL
ncbi:MAG: ABC transporter ATP-binding protein [Desulfovibrionaceae bacterium]|nr:ABC transporter ATP-binding protein [Desulfovibrionaceae bacterium]